MTAPATETAISLRDSVSGREWVAGGLASGGGLAALDATIRPIDALAAAGLGALTGYVRPLQDVVDRMAGKSGAIQTFADGWQRAAAVAERVQDQLARAVSADTAQWRAAAGDRYRNRANEITSALRGVSALATATGSAARAVGEALASARQNAGDLLTDLVQRLISYVSQAKAAAGGVTPAVLSQATAMINSYQAPIADVEQQLQQTISNALRQLDGTVQVAGLAGAPGAVAAILPTWKALQDRLDSTVQPAQQIIQLPPPTLPADARPLSKADLDRIAQNPIFYGRLGYRVTIGDYAEDAALRALGFEPNNRRFHPYANSPNPLDRRRFIVPDGVSDREDVSITVDSRGIPISTETHTTRDGLMVEVKATGGTITLEEPRDQMRKYIDLLADKHQEALRADPNAPTPWLVYAATTESQLDPNALAYADSKGVAVWRAQLHLSGPEHDPLISVDTPAPQNAAANQGVGTAPPPPMQPTPLFNSPYDQLLRHKTLKEEEN